MTDEKITLREIRQLKTGDGNVNVHGKVMYMGEIRTFNKYGRTLRVLTVVIADKTGEIELNLWNDQCDNIKVGDEVKVINGYVSEWQEKRQLTLGKFGTMELIS